VMSGLKKDTDEALEDTNSLLKMIGGIKKKEVPEKPPEPEPPLTYHPAEENSADAGDFSALLKKLGMAKKDAPAAPAEQPVQRVSTPSPAPNQPDEMSFSDIDDLQEDAGNYKEADAPPSPDGKAGYIRKRCTRIIRKTAQYNNGNPDFCTSCAGTCTVPPPGKKRTRVVPGMGRGTRS
jgi:hypothetical protein